MRYLKIFLLYYVLTSLSISNIHYYIVNWVSESKEFKDYNKTKFILSRIAGQNSFVWSEFLFGVLLSSSGEIDLLKLNPYINGNTLQVLLHLVTITMLRANRLGHTNRCIGTAINLEELLVKVMYIIYDVDAAADDDDDDDDEFDGEHKHFSHVHWLSNLISYLHNTSLLSIIHFFTSIL